MFGTRGFTTTNTCYITVQVWIISVLFPCMMDGTRFNLSNNQPLWENGSFPFSHTVPHHGCIVSLETDPLKRTKSYEYSHNRIKFEFVSADIYLVSVYKVARALATSFFRTITRPVSKTAAEIFYSSSTLIEKAFLRACVYCTHIYFVHTAVPCVFCLLCILTQVTKIYSIYRTQVRCK